MLLLEEIIYQTRLLHIIKADKDVPIFIMSSNLRCFNLKASLQDIFPYKSKMKFSL